ncbi:MAG: enoyl-CoA hydratase/isomerase family protein, partial [Pseudomonadota bacterium]|nr:enoyl-CoA hydratase/isomerase family protein [Pseudomonadota bacterium]
MFDLRIDGVIARLTLSRAEARNAIPVAGWAELARLASAAVTRGARVLIVAGAPGGGFCAGADIADFDGFQRNDAARS